MRSEEREVEIMTRAVTAWGHARWPGCRAIREMAMGDRRIDLLFVREADLIGIELKSSVDKLDRLEAQMLEFSRFVPEVWIGFAPCWHDKITGTYRHANRLLVDGPLVIPSSIVRAAPGQPGRRAMRDELSIMRLLELIWREEAAAIAERTGVVPGARHTQMRNAKLKPMLARLLTGNEILREVCTELRARTLVGRGSDRPMRPGAEPVQGLSIPFRPKVAAVLE